MAILKGTNAGDTLYGTSAGDEIYGYGGNDSLKGFGGADRLDGGAGIDTVFYGDSSAGVAVNLMSGRGFGGSAEGDTLISIENVFGSNHNDTLIGSWGSNELHGGYGNDIIKGMGGADRLYGENGDDILQSGGGNAILDGGAGSDTADYSDWGSGVTVSLGDPLPYWAGLPTHHDQFISIENLTGGAGQDILVGDGGTNVLRGLGGQDNLIGGGGADFMYGGADGDSYYVDNGGDIVMEYAGEGFDAVWVSTSYTLTAGSEVEQLNVEDHTGTAAINLTGNEFANTINGNYGDNIINGGTGADVMNGWKGNDTYFVDNLGDDLFENYQEGFDTVFTSVTFSTGKYSEIEVLQAIGTASIDLVGSIDNNRIIGNDGQNTIVGSYGKDTVTGNGGGDTFVWSAVEEIGLFNFDPDIVTDFNRGAGDLLAFNPIDADETVAGNQAFTFIDTAAFTGAGQIRWSTNGVDTFVELNTNADLTVDGIIQLLGVQTVDASFFVL